MASALRGVLFDKDGTLVDFNASWQPAYRLAAERLARLADDPGLAARLMDDGGWDAERGHWRPGSLLTSASNAEIIDHWLAQSPLTRRDEVERMILDTFHQAALDGTVAVQGIGELFAELAGHGYHLGVATMDDERTARTTLSALGLDPYTEFVCGADSGHGIKPQAGMFHAFCHAVSLSPDEVVMVGDSPHDLNMGRAAGAGLVVGVLTGAHVAADLAPIADLVLADATGLREVLQRDRALAMEAT